MTDWVEQGLKELGPLIKDSGIGWLHIDFRLGEIPDAYEYEGYAASVRFSMYPKTHIVDYKIELHDNEDGNRSKRVHGKCTSLGEAFKDVDKRFCKWILASQDLKAV